MSVTATNSGSVTEPPANATYQDVIDAPPHFVAEIVGGCLHLTPSPPARCSRALSALMMKIFTPFELDKGPGEWMILRKPEVHLSEEVVVPDIAGWRKPWENCDPDAPYETNTPDWVCEVLAPSTRHIDLGPKRDIYADHGVSNLWILDPSARTLDAYVPRDGGWVSAGSASDQDMVCLPPFEAISFPIGDLWR